MTAPLPISLLILGYGNPLRGDDAVGYLLADQLLSLPHPPTVEIIPSHQLLPEMAHTISRSARIIFIDSTIDPSHPPGHITRRQLSPSTTSRPMTHHLTPESLLALARDLYSHCPPATLITIAISHCTHSENLSPAVEHARQQLLQSLLNESASPTPTHLP